MTRRPALSLLCGGLLALAAGCAGRSHVASPGAKGPTDADPAAATADDWYARPAGHAVQADAFDALWLAAEQVARNYLFTLDRRDPRNGVLTTEPLTGKQFFEVWRRDVQAIDDVAHSSLATVRRTVRFEFARAEDGAWRVTPKALVEQLATTGQRVTNVAAYRTIFEPGQQRGSIEEDQGIHLPGAYWYAVGRDETLEKVLAGAIRRELRR